MNSTAIEERVGLNRRAVSEYVDAALHVSSAIWTQPARSGKWSAAQVTEHLAIEYELAAQFLEGTSGIPGRKPPRLLRPLPASIWRSNPLLRMSLRLPPGASSPPHRHSGFVAGCVVAGAVTFQAAGQPARTYKE